MADMSPIATATSASASPPSSTTAVASVSLVHPRAPPMGSLSLAPPLGFSCVQTQKRRRQSGIEGAGVGNKRVAGPRGLGYRNRASSSVSSDGSLGILRGDGWYSMINILSISISILFYYFVRLIFVRYSLAVSLSVINSVKSRSLEVFRSRLYFSYVFKRV